MITPTNQKHSNPTMNTTRLITGCLVLASLMSLVQSLRAPHASRFMNSTKQMKAKSPFIRAALLALLLATVNQPLSVSRAAAVVSDGSDGAFHPANWTTIDLNSAAPDGVLNFTTIHIPPGIAVNFVANNSNTPVFLAATGDILIEGTIMVNGTDYFAIAGPGGGAAGAEGRLLGTAGGGLSGGQPGGPATVYLNTSVHANAGGGGGMATPGRVATSRTGTDPGLGGAAVARPTLVPGVSGGGGSGGAGGGGIDTFGFVIPGGRGGGGGGGLQLSTPGKITITGSILANGGHGEAGYGNGLNDSCGPGGGGAGGNIELYAGTLEFQNAVVQARGGYGGSLSSEPQSFDPFLYSSGAAGGRGYFHVSANSMFINPGTRIDAASNISRPALRNLSRQGSDLVFTGTGGTNQVFEVLTSTNVTLSLTNWTTFRTNVCDASGNFIFTNAMTPGNARRFFLLRGH